MATERNHIRELIDKLEALPPERIAEVEDFVEFLAGKARKRAALDRLLAVAPALEAAGSTPLSEEEVVAEVKAVRDDRRARQAAKDSDADRS